VALLSDALAGGAKVVRRSIEGASGDAVLRFAQLLVHLDSRPNSSSRSCGGAVPENTRPLDVGSARGPAFAAPALHKNGSSSLPSTHDITTHCLGPSPCAAAARPGCAHLSSTCLRRAARGNAVENVINSDSDVEMVNAMEPPTPADTALKACRHIIAPEPAQRTACAAVMTRSPLHPTSPVSRDGASAAPHRKAVLAGKARVPEEALSSRSNTPRPSSASAACGQPPALPPDLNSASPRVPHTQSMHFLHSRERDSRKRAAARCSQSGSPSEDGITVTNQHATALELLRSTSHTDMNTLADWAIAVTSHGREGTRRQGHLCGHEMREARWPTGPLAQQTLDGTSRIPSPAVPRQDTPSSPVAPRRPPPSPRGPSAKGPATRHAPVVRTASEAVAFMEDSQAEIALTGPLKGRPPVFAAAQASGHRAGDGQQTVCLPDDSTRAMLSAAVGAHRFIVCSVGANSIDAISHQVVSRR
jgi:hypothetical protein